MTTIKKITFTPTTDIKIYRSPIPGGDRYFEATSPAGEAFLSEDSGNAFEGCEFTGIMGDKLVVPMALANDVWDAAADAGLIVGLAR